MLQVGTQSVGTVDPATQVPAAELAMLGKPAQVC